MWFFSKHPRSPPSLFKVLSVINTFIQHIHRAWGGVYMKRSSPFPREFLLIFQYPAVPSVSKGS